MKRHLVGAGVPGTDLMGRRELFREAARQGLTGDPTQSIQYHDARNATIQNYDEANARRVFDSISAFSKYANYLLDLLTTRVA